MLNSFQRHLIEHKMAHGDLWNVVYFSLITANFRTPDILEILAKLSVKEISRNFIRHSYWNFFRHAFWNALQNLDKFPSVLFNGFFSEHSPLNFSGRFFRIPTDLFFKDFANYFKDSSVRNHPGSLNCDRRFFQDYRWRFSRESSRISSRFPESVPLLFP